MNMEFAELIKISRIDHVRLRRPGKPPSEVTVAVTGHHTIFSNTEDSNLISHREIWLLHRGIQSVTRETDTARSGTLGIKYKDLRTFFLDIIGSDNLNALHVTLQALSGVEEISSSYPFFYNPGFKALEDGWHLFRPEEEYAKIVSRPECGWRISKVNQEFGVCPTYGKLVLVPSGVTDNQIINSAKHRIGGRFPVLSYLHTTPARSKGTISPNDLVPPELLCRGTVPLVRASYTVAGWRNGDDERLMAGVKGLQRKGFILCINHDKSKGSLASNPEYDSVYAQWKRVNVKLASLGDLRDSLNSIATACNDPSNEKWISRLANAHWLSYVKETLNAACLAAQLLEKEEAPVLILEAESADLSLVLVSLTQMILNPDSRTLHGFQALIEREWIQGGHPFWTRHGQQQPNTGSETGPVFLLLLDAVYQIYIQFPCSFEFTDKILVLLADHSFSSSFGTFLCDNEQERQQYSVREHTVSLWSYLNQVEILSGHLNSLYSPNKSVIWPSVAPMSIVLWTSFFLRWVQDQNNQTYERRKIIEIIERNKSARATALKLRKELKELKDEAMLLGVLRPDEELLDTTTSLKDLVLQQPEA